MSEEIGSNEPVPRAITDPSVRRYLDRRAADLGKVLSGANSTKERVDALEVEADGNTASVAEVKRAVTDGSGAYAYYGLKVNASDEVASIEALADSKDNISVLRFEAGRIELNGTVIINGTVITDALAANAVTNRQISQTATEIALVSGAYTSVGSLVFTSVGIGVSLRASADFYMFNFTSMTWSPQVSWRLKRGSTVVKSGAIIGGVTYDTSTGFETATVRGTVVVDFGDVVASGSYTYTLEIYCVNSSTNGSNAQSASNRVIEAVEYKR